jgi:hypothetical protein
VGERDEGERTKYNIDTGERACLVRRKGNTETREDEEDRTVKTKYVEMERGEGVQMK